MSHLLGWVFVKPVCLKLGMFPSFTTLQKTRFGRCHWTCWKGGWKMEDVPKPETQTFSSCLVCGNPLKIGHLPSLKLTWPLKICSWETTFLLGPGLFSGTMLVSGRVIHRKWCYVLIQVTFRWVFLSFQTSHQKVNPTVWLIDIRDDILLCLLGILTMAHAKKTQIFYESARIMKLVFPWSFVCCFFVAHLTAGFKPFLLSEPLELGEEKMSRFKPISWKPTNLTSWALDFDQTTGIYRFFSFIDTSFSVVSYLAWCLPMFI